MQSGKQTASQCAATFFNSSSQENKPTFNLKEAILEPLPEPLLDRRQETGFMSSWKKLNRYSQGQATHDELFIPVLSDKRHLICPFTHLLMTHPVRSAPDRRAIEREAYEAKENTTVKKDLLVASDVAEEINRLIQAHPRLKDLRYIPRCLITAMANACEQGQVEKIRELYQINSLLLLATHSVSTWVPLQLAIQKKKSLDVIIQLLDERLKGLALMCLMQPDQSGRLPLENALRYGELDVIQKLMAWMGENEVMSFRLTGPLPQNRQFLLNRLLLVSIVREKEGWAKKALFWGADLSAVINDQKKWVDAQDVPVNTAIIEPLLLLWNEMPNCFPILSPRALSVSPRSQDDTIPEDAFSSSPRAAQSDLSQEQKQNSNGVVSQFFSSAPNKSNDSLNEVSLFMHAILNDQDAVVSEMLTRNSKLALVSMASSHLSGLRVEHSIRPALTGLQYADRLNRQSICKIIINVLGDQLASIQIGHERVAALKTEMRSIQLSR